MSDLEEIRDDYEKLFGRKPPKSKKEKEDWMVKKIDEEQSLLIKVERLGYKGKFRDVDIKKFIIEVAEKRNYKIQRSSYHLAVNELLAGKWVMESKINPKNDSASITARYIINEERKSFILPSSLSAEQRKEYPLLIKDELAPRFKEQINKRLLPHLKRNDYDTTHRCSFQNESENA